MADLLEHALNYAKKGIAVFPLIPRTKKPITKNGFKDATTDEMQIKEWWTEHPNANIGCATGEKSGGLCVIDLDFDEEKGKNGFKVFKEWEAEHGNILPSWMSKTGRGGYHYFFRSKEPVKNRVDIMPGIDIRGDGGYVVLPPSIHENGNQYTWQVKPGEYRIADANDTIKFFLQTGEETPTQTYLAPDIIPSGQRNHLIFKFACMMQAKGSSDETVFAAAMAENKTKCRPPLSEKEIQSIVKSALKYEKGKPIYVSNEGEAYQGRRDPVFALTQDGKIKKTSDNIREAIECDEIMWNSIRYNELAFSPYIFGKVPWNQDDQYRRWDNNDDAALRMYLEKRYGFSSKDKVADALRVVATKQKYNPVVDTLEQIYSEYNGEADAIRKLLPTYMGAEDSDYNHEVMKLFMLGAICRVYHPGCKFDYVLTLYGEQGIGKSEFLRRLAIDPEWFNDNFTTFEGDKAIEKLAGMWMVEIAELKALKSAKDSETVKAFLTSRCDNYRVPYDRRTEQRPRMCVFAGTTNQKNVFVDKTGNRRFLPVVARKDNVKKSLFENSEDVNYDIRQAWGEAMKLFKDADCKPELILPNEYQKEAERAQLEFSEDDYRVGQIQEWLDETDCAKVCVPMLIEHALNIDMEKCSKQFKREVMEIMDNEITSWERLKNKDKSRSWFAKYGNQITFIKTID